MIGSMIGPYEITESIGEGGMGTVFRGIDTMLEREVAIKMLRPELASQPQVVERFRTEAITLAKLNHPNVATLYSFLRQGDDYFMIMEFVRGETLDEIIRKHGAMSCERAISLFCHALEGIEHAHKMGVIHRDIKPANMMLTKEGVLKVMDFGIARVLGSARMTRHGNIIGTIEYMSPEQVRGEETDARSDIYSLGILLYEMLTGRIPFESKSEFELMRSQIEDAPEPPTTFADHIPLELEQAIMRSLAKMPDARFQTANEFRAQLLNTISSGTNKLKSAEITYAAPKTRILEPLPQSEPLPTPQPPQSTTFKTRLDEPVIARTKLNEPVATGGDEIKATRLDATVPLGPEQTELLAPPQEVQEVKEAQQEVQPAQPSSKKRLNWMHYTGAAVILMLLIGVPFALITGKKQTPIEVPAAVESSDAAPEASESSAPPAETGTNPSDTSNAVAPNAQPDSESSDRDNTKASPTHTPRSEKDAEGPKASETPTAAAERPAPEQTQPKEETAAAPKKAEKPAEANKDKKEKKGLFGKIKGIFGGDDKADDKKKKPEKKP